MISSLTAYCPTLLNAKDKNGFTPLYYACKRGNLELVNFLIQRKANVTEKQGPHEETILHASSTA